MEFHSARKSNYSNSKKYSNKVVVDYVDDDDEQASGRLLLEDGEDVRGSIKNLKEHNYAIREIDEEDANLQRLEEI